jgi:hypothetical protein
MLPATPAVMRPIDELHGHPFAGNPMLSGNACPSNSGHHSELGLSA